MNKNIKVAAAQYGLSFFNSLEEWKEKCAYWVEEAAAHGAQYLLFPEYGSLELSSLLPEKTRENLKSQTAELSKFTATFMQTFQDLAKKHKVYIISPSLPCSDNNKVTNRTYCFSPNGKFDYQEKIFMTRFEDEEWGVEPGDGIIKVFETPELIFSIVICFDIEFAFPALAAAHKGAQVLFVPSCTESIQGMNRVHIGARARALENQVYAVVSQTVGEAEWCAAVDKNTGCSAFYATPDTGFTDDGIIKAGKINEISWVYADLSLEKLDGVRRSGAVFNFKKHGNFLQNQHEFFKIKNVIL